MRGTAQITSPDEVEATVTVTATVGQWRQIRKNLEANDTSSINFKNLLGKLIYHIEKRSIEELGGAE